ncbi:arabinogalactan oligomer/maltooligosaccharide transport system permease protein [Halorubrum trapanicum]|uniref:Arabinogalactan oligomer/maltooligosaccharide transport system permease protein n=1 Tax=Halorubrum trapanicum TaxID=29284 RepID=A0A8J7R8K4_9EURY|nr:ABC transporter permease subunit [Halorubrum trapanicum]MBP1902117.1 arabinogalactan oligomer/maltooligosaccharide transport system permease protein [Halorubrum trapanicum]
MNPLGSAAALVASAAALVRSKLVALATAPKRFSVMIRRAVYDVRTGKRTSWDVTKSVLMTLFGLAMVLVLLFPLFWITSASLAEGSRLFNTSGIFPDPSTYNLGAYRWVIFESDFFFVDGDWGYPQLVIGGGGGLLPFSFRWAGTETGPGALFNSLYIVSVTLAAGFGMIVPAAYAFSRRQFVGRKRILYGYVLFTQIGAGLSIATLVALYSLFSTYGLTNNLFVLGLFYAASAIPFNTWLLKTYMDNIPVSYEEAAMVDGASFLDTIREVILPLTKPGLAVVLIFVWLAGWNEFIIAQTLLRPENYPLSVELYNIATEGRFSTPWTRFAAFANLFALPVAIVYFAAQRSVEDGLSFGGMEG